DDFVEQSGSPRHAINCMLSAYYMAEWIWGDWRQTDYATWKALGIRDRESFLASVDKSQFGSRSRKRSPTAASTSPINWPKPGLLLAMGTSKMDTKTACLRSKWKRAVGLKPSS